MPRATLNAMPLAGFGDRLLAYLIDALILFGVACVLAVPAGIAMFAVIGAQVSSLPTDPQTGEIVGDPNFGLIFGPLVLIELVLAVLIMVVSYLYHVELSPSQRATTLGKRAMKLRVVFLDDPSGSITRGVAAKRWAMQYLLGSVVPFYQWVDGLWQLWDKPHQQCLHDKAAKTVVVKVST